MDLLYQIAESKAGYFTTSDASHAGYSRSLLSHHVGSGMLERVDRGVYRLSRFPEMQRGDLVVGWLRAGEDAAVSHESALELHGLSDVLPFETHVTVSRTSSRRRSGLRFHTSRLCPGDVTTLDGVRVTTVERTIADVARAGMSDELVMQAIGEALDRGLTTPDRLAEKMTGRRATSLLEAVLGGRRS